MSQGGAIYIENNEVSINNCTFKGNHASEGAAIFFSTISIKLNYNKLLINPKILKPIIKLKAK